MHPLMALLIILLLPVGIIGKLLDKEKERKARERQEQKDREYWARKKIIDEQWRVEKARRDAEENLLKEKKEQEFFEAATAGVDVCYECKTIRPKRCTEPGCGKCITYIHCCNGSRYSNEFCSGCQYRRAKTRCQQSGEGFCEECGAVNPDRCGCGLCLECHHRVNYLCYACDDAINGD